MEPAGDRIAGSRLYRGYCGRCGDPMRVSCPHPSMHDICHDCVPKFPLADVRSFDACGGDNLAAAVWDNVVRTVEENRYG